MLHYRLQQRTLHTGARREDREYCLTERIALRERSQFGLCIYFKLNNKVNQFLNYVLLMTEPGHRWVDLLVYIYMYIYLYLYIYR